MPEEWSQRTHLLQPDSTDAISLGDCERAEHRFLEIGQLISSKCTRIASDTCTAVVEI